MRSNEQLQEVQDKLMECARCMRLDMELGIVSYEYRFTMGLVGCLSWAMADESEADIEFGDMVESLK